MESRNPLGQILILSAIDALLCAFTAALILFLVGAEAGASSQGDTGKLTGQAERREGFAAVSIVADYGATLGRLAPAPGLSYEMIPAENSASASTVVWLVDNNPTSGRPFVLENDGVSALNAKLGMSGTRFNVSASVTCKPGERVQLLFAASRITMHNGPCTFTADEPVRSSATTK